MLDYLKSKKAEIEAQKIEPSTIYEDLERKIDEYRSQLYAERDAEIANHNKMVDAKVSILNEMIEETEKSLEVVKAEEKDFDEPVKLSLSNSFPNGNGFVL